jgi:uncharacterized coiled-coil protein SlyX
MSDDQNTGTTTPEGSVAPQQDEIKNLKAEMNRKLENTNAQLAALLNELKQKSAPSAAQSSPAKVSVFDDEEAYARRIKEETAREIESKLEARQAQQTKYQTVVNQLVSEYPEANDTSSELYKRAQEHYAQLDDSEKANPLALKAAVTSAAAELGMKPKSKRQKSSDDGFTMSSSSTGHGTKRKDDLDQGQMDFARMMGLNVDDPKVRERIKSRKVNIIR